MKIPITLNGKVICKMEIISDETLHSFRQRLCKKLHKQMYVETWRAVSSRVKLKDGRKLNIGDEHPFNSKEGTMGITTNGGRIYYEYNKSLKELGFKIKRISV